MSVASWQEPSPVSFTHPHILSVYLTSVPGTISVFFTYPLEVVRVRMAFHTRHSNAKSTTVRPSFIGAARFMYREGTSSATSTASSEVSISKNVLDRFPVLKFYRGFTVTVAGMIPYAGVSFLSWGFLRAYFIPQSEAGRKERATPIADLGIGAISGAVGQTASYPFEIVRRRMQVGGITQPDRWLRWSETVRAVWQAKGWRGFYVGLGIGFLKVVPMTAVSFAVWQGGKRLLDV